MKSTVPSVHCDDRDGCDQWAVDYYEMGADNWRSLLPAGWVYDPRGEAFCPQHAVVCALCQGYGWTGSRHDNGPYGGHYHCECGAPCRVDRCKGARSTSAMESWER